MNRKTLLFFLIFPCLGARCPLPIAFAVDDPVQSGRDGLNRWWGYPWYDSATDDVKRIDVVEPWYLDWDWSLNLSLGELFQWLAWLLIAAALIFLIYFLVQMYLRRRRGLEGVDAAAFGADAAARQRIEALPFPVAGGRLDLLGEARRRYQAGDYTRAIVYLFSYQLVQLDKHQHIRLARGKTNRQYLRELGPRQSLRRLLERTMVCFEEVFFGRRTLDRPRFDSCWSHLAEFEDLAAV